MENPIYLDIVSWAWVRYSSSPVWSVDFLGVNWGLRSATWKTVIWFDYCGWKFSHLVDHPLMVSRFAITSGDLKRRLTLSVLNLLSYAVRKELGVIKVVSFSTWTFIFVDKETGSLRKVLLRFQHFMLAKHAQRVKNKCFLSVKTHQTLPSLPSIITMMCTRLFELMLDMFNFSIKRSFYRMSKQQFDVNRT